MLPNIILLVTQIHTQLFQTFYLHLIFFACITDMSKIAVIGVHIRLTDYAHHLDVLFSLKLVKFDYIVRAMDIFRTMMKDKVCIIYGPKRLVNEVQTFCL